MKIDERVVKECIYELSRPINNRKDFLLNCALEKLEQHDIQNLKQFDEELDKLYKLSMKGKRQHYNLTRLLKNSCSLDDFVFERLITILEDMV